MYLFAGAAYLQATTHWTSTFRTVLGVRDDYQHGTDVDYLAALHETAGYTNGGTAAQSLLQPKGSLIYTPTDTSSSTWRRQRISQRRSARRQSGHERGLGTAAHPAAGAAGGPGSRACAPRLERNLALTFAVYNLWQQSETIIDPDVGQDTAGPAEPPLWL